MKREVWKIYSINDLTINIIDGDRGENYPTINDFSSDGYCLFLNANNVTKNGFFFKKNNFINKEKYLQLGSGKVLQNDIIVTTRGTVGNFAFVDADVPYKIMRLNSGMLILRNDDPRIDTKYLYIALRDYIFHREFSRIISGSAQPQLPAKDLKYFHIIFPESHTEQSRIASILSSCDDTIRTTQAVIDKYKAIKQGMMRDLFTRGLAADGTLRPSYEQQPELYKPSELGMIPKGWDVKNMGECCTMKAGEGITDHSISDAGLYPVYGGNGKRGMTSTYTHKGTYVLIGRQGALCGNVNIVSGLFFASEHAVVVSEYGFMNSLWMYYKCSSMNLNQYSEASAQPGLSVKKILHLYIATPDLSEQQAIADRLSAIDASISSEEALLAKYQAVKQGLMDRLLTPPADAIIEDETEGAHV